MKKDMRRTLSERLDALMTKRKISNYRMAKDLDIVEGTIRKWRTGKTTPGSQNLQKVAEYLMVEPIWLLEGVEHRRYSSSVIIERIAHKLEQYSKTKPNEIPKIEHMIDLLLGTISTPPVSKKVTPEEDPDPITGHNN